jgi:acyl-coenzyme A synthetase/AMP-(fatty) acid ligase
MLFPSPRYGAEAIAKLIDQIDGSRIMLSPIVPLPVVAEIIQRRPMRTLKVPSLETLLTYKRPPYPFTKTFGQHKHEPFLTLHTSGTTGFPKPILWTHDWVNSVLQCQYLPTISDRLRASRHLQGPDKRLVFYFPAFHTSGIFGQLFLPLGTGAVTVLPPNASTPAATMEAMSDVIDLTCNNNDNKTQKVHVLVAPPPHLEYLASQAPLLDRVSQNIKMAMFGGGSISAAAGTTLAKKMQVFNDMGTTESGLWPSLERPKPDESNKEEVYEFSQYTTVHPAFNIRLNPVSTSSEGDVCEAIMVRNSDESGFVQPFFKIFTNEKEVSLGDLFVRHPRYPELWKHIGRVDEMLNFITNEKFQPAAAELRIMAHPAVEEVMIVGTRRPRGALIMRMKEGRTLEDAWEIVDEVNGANPVYARVTKDMVLVVKEPFLLTAKGSIRKKAMLDLYQGQLDALYEKSPSAP